jgi:hypothetical protein
MKQKLLKRVTFIVGEYFARKEKNILFEMDNNNWKIDIINDFFTKNLKDKTVAVKATELSRDFGLDEKVYNLEYWQQKQINAFCEAHELISKVKKSTTSSYSSSSSYGCGGGSSNYGC